MGEPAVPDRQSRLAATRLAEQILESVRRDECVADSASSAYALWLLASTLIYWRDNGVDAYE